MTINKKYVQMLLKFYSLYKNNVFILSIFEFKCASLIFFKSKIYECIKIWNIYIYDRKNPQYCNQFIIFLIIATILKWKILNFKTMLFKNNKLWKCIFWQKHKTYNITIFFSHGNGMNFFHNIINDITNASFWFK
jgi:hypothetical protein